MSSHLSQDTYSQPDKAVTVREGLLFILDWVREERAVRRHSNDQKCCLVALYLNISLTFLSSMCVCFLNGFKPLSQMDLESCT